MLGVNRVCGSVLELIKEVLGSLATSSTPCWGEGGVEALDFADVGLSLFQVFISG